MIILNFIYIYIYLINIRWNMLKILLQHRRVLMNQVRQLTKRSTTAPPYKFTNFLHRYPKLRSMADI